MRHRCGQSFGSKYFYSMWAPIRDAKNGQRDSKNQRFRPLLSGLLKRDPTRKTAALRASGLSFSIILTHPPDFLPRNMAGLESHPLIEPLFCGLIIVFHIVREFWDNCGKFTPFIPAQTQLNPIKINFKWKTRIFMLAQDLHSTLATCDGYGCSRCKTALPERAHNPNQKLKL